MTESDTHDTLLDVAGKTVLITAAASGMGLAASTLFARRGAKVIAVDVDADALDAVVDELTGDGLSIEGHVADLTDLASIEALIETVLSRHDVLDVLYNHAGLRGQVSLDYDAAGLVATTTINLLAPMLLTQRLLPILRKSPSASLIYTASISGLGASAGLAIYGATKAGLINYMKSVAVLVGPEGMRSNAILPGATMTAGMIKNNADDKRSALADRIPLRRLGEPEDDAAVALFLASDASRYVTGVAIPVDGGLSL